MYATINLPGSTHFHSYGPASRAACEEWLVVTMARLARTAQLTSLLPQQVVSNQTAERWRYRDGTHVVQPGASMDIGCPECGKPAWAPQHDSVCPVGRQDSAP